MKKYTREDVIRMCEEQDVEFIRRCLRIFWEILKI